MNLTTEQYEALVTLARDGVSGDADRTRQLEVWLRQIEKGNGITRYAIRLRWLESKAPEPKVRDFPLKWPPELDAVMERTDRPISRADVEEYLKEKARQPVNVMVTKDLGGIAGWTKLEDFFIR